MDTHVGNVRKLSKLLTNFRVQSAYKGIHNLLEMFSTML